MVSLKNPRGDDPPALAAALKTAAAGYPVFPVRLSWNKKDRKLAKTPLVQDWRGKATTDETEIRNMWPSTANAYGIDCDTAGLVVVDLDVKADGPDNWAKLVADEGLELPPLVAVRTTSGGFHHYYRDPTGEMRNSAGKVATGVDVRASGGYVVGPGSVWGDAAYTGVDQDGLPPVSEVPEAPEPLLAVLKSRKAQERPAPIPSGVPLGAVGQGVALIRELSALLEQEEGGRNDQLNRAAFAMGQILGGGGLNEDAVRGALEEAGRQAGLETDEILKSIDSGLASGSTEPRAVAPTPEELYQPLDLAEWFSTDHPDPERFGRGGLIYEGGFHIIAGEPASGKSVLAYAWMIDAMKDGHRAVLLDEEAGPRDALGKMLALGATPKLLKEKLTYLDPKGRDLELTRQHFHRLVTSGGVRVVVVDSLGAALAISGKSENDNSEVGSFLKQVVMPLAKEHGVAVLLIDHKTKGDTGRYARGASVKLQLVDVQLNVVASKPFSKDDSGWLTIECNKNRFGDYGEGYKWKADVLTGDGGIFLDIERFTEADERSAFIDDKLTQAIARHYRSIHPKAFAVRNLHELKHIKELGSKAKIETAAIQLRMNGVLTRKNSNSPLEWNPDQTAIDLKDLP